MPTYLTHVATYTALWPMLALVALVTALLFPFVRSAKKAGIVVLALVAFALLGVVSGVVTGLSRESAVGAVLPAVLSLVGVLVLYMLGFEKGDPRLVSGCVIALTATLGVGVMWGSVLRDDSGRENIQLAEDLAWQRQDVPYRKARADVEAEVRKYRLSLGLSPVEPEVKEPEGKEATKGKN